MTNAVTDHTRVGLVLAALAMLLVSCNGKEPASAARTGNDEDVPVIYTTTYPMQYFAERIGRGKALVFRPVPGDQAAFLETVNADMIRAYRSADLIVINGAGYDSWIEMLFLNESRIVDTSKPFEKDFIVVTDAITHSHGPAGAHSHGHGHTWLDPVLAKIQAEEIRKAMTARFPAHAAEFQEGFSSLAGDLEELDRLLADLSKQYDGRPLLASHPSYGYLARRCRWNVVDLDPGLDPTMTPDDAALEAIRRVLKTCPAKYILWETRPGDEVARRLEGELGLKGVVFSRCRELSESDGRTGRDYMKIMEENVANIREVFVEDRDPP